MKGMQRGELEGDDLGPLEASSISQILCRAVPQHVDTMRAASVACTAKLSACEPPHLASIASELARPLLPDERIVAGSYAETSDAAGHFQPSDLAHLTQVKARVGHGGLCLCGAVALVVTSQLRKLSPLHLSNNGWTLCKLTAARDRPACGIKSALASGQSQFASTHMSSATQGLAFQALRCDLAVACSAAAMRRGSVNFEAQGTTNSTRSFATPDVPHALAVQAMPSAPGAVLLAPGSIYRAQDLTNAAQPHAHSEPNEELAFASTDLVPPWLISSSLTQDASNPT